MYPGVGKSGSPAPKLMTGLPAAFSALALASTASVADSEMADTRAETLVGMRSILPSALSAPRLNYHPGLAVRRKDGSDVHCMNRQPGCRCGSVPMSLWARDLNPCSVV